jgi:DNA ligase (NAD+)
METRIQELEQQIQYHSDCYYNEGKPEISDAEFDALWDELESLDPNNEVLQTVGASIKGAKLKHKVQMGSLSKVNKEAELLKWAKTDTTHFGINDRKQLSLTPKIDGLAVRLNYFNGKLVQAATRGDGIEGQDVTANILEIADIPSQTDQGFSGEIRGEVYMKRSVFKELQEAGLPFANPRNAAAGSLMQKDPKKTGERRLSFKAYDIMYDDCPHKTTLNTETEKFWALKRLSGFDVVENKRVLVDELDKILYDWEHNKRETLDYDIDGLVFGFTSLAAQEDAGWSGKRPRGKIAWKFKPEQKETVLEAIDWQVGRTGKLTPVARVRPTQLAGTCVQNVTLHNYKTVKELKLQPGDKLLIEKAGEIIPHLVRVAEQAENWTDSRPEECPCCSGEVIEEGAHLVCIDPTCKAQLEARVEHYLKRLGVLGAGPSAIRGLVACEAITDLSDLYFMNSDDVRVALGSDVVARNLMQEIFNKDELPLATFLSSLGIHTLGRTTSKALAKEYRSLDAVRSATLLSLLRIDGIGDTSASAISEGLEAMSATIDRILEVIDVMEVEDASGPLAGMTFCLTGAMSRPRKVIAAEIESAGGEVRSSVGKGLSYLVQADPSSASSKSKKAKANGTEVIGEDKLKELMAS